MKKSFIVMLSLFLLGCATVGRPIAADSVNQIQKGKTTKEEIVKVFGQPDSTTFDANSRLVYSYNAAKASNTAWNFIPGVNLLHSEMKMKTQTLIVVFSKDGVVEDYSFINSDKPMKYGLIP